MRNNQGVSSALLVLLCDIKTGGNDTIEVTVVSFDSFFFSLKQI